MIVAEEFSVVRADLGEGPMWDPVRRRLLWVDILAGRVLSTDIEGTTSTVMQFPEPVSALAMTEEGGVIAACRSGLRSLEEPDALLCAFPCTPMAGLRPNDGNVDPAGRFLVGTMAMPHPIDGAGHLWSFESLEAPPRQLFQNVTISNGVDWSPDGTQMYYVDSATRRVDVFDYDIDTGQATDRRIHLDLTDVTGVPDGLCVDSLGNLWIALWGAGRVHCYDHHDLVETIACPTPLVTSVAFMNDDLKTLAITSASIERPGSPVHAAGGNIFLAQGYTAGRDHTRIGSWIKCHNLVPEQPNIPTECS